MTRRRALVGLGVLAIVVVAVAAAVLWPRGTTEISEQDALDDFRQASSTTTRPTTDAAPLPAAGVYTYAATGQEDVKLGPLPAETRPLPETVTAVVVPAADDCTTWTLNLFVEHTEDTTWCVDDGDLTLDEHVKHQRIGALSPTATMTCDPAVVHRDGEDGPLDLECALTLDGGPASITATLTGTATTTAAETMAIGDDDVEVTSTTTTYEVSGDLRGTWAETTWWSAAHLPVRVEREIDLSGPATLSEQIRLELTSLEPST